ncbi:MAG: hypothetical protein JW818_15870 [Pirellulales bacterium]|nr:hypothetical protein [Pirellulales bacterium]
MSAPSPGSRTRPRDRRVTRWVAGASLFLFLATGPLGPLLHRYSGCGCFHDVHASRDGPCAHGSSCGHRAERRAAEGPVLLAGHASGHAKASCPFVRFQQQRSWVLPDLFAENSEPLVASCPPVQPTLRPADAAPAYSPRAPPLAPIRLS